MNRGIEKGETLVEYFPPNQVEAGSGFVLVPLSINISHPRLACDPGENATSPRSEHLVKGDSFRGRQTPTLANEQGGNCPRWADCRE